MTLQSKVELDAANYIPPILLLPTSADLAASRHRRWKRIIHLGTHTEFRIRRTDKQWRALLKAPNTLIEQRLALKLLVYLGTLGTNEVLPGF